jgi:hypothetical protein
MKNLLLKATVFSIMLASFGCVSSVVKDQAQTRVAISDGKVRLLQYGTVSKEDLMKMVLDDREGWYALNHYVNDGPESPTTVILPTPVTPTTEVR